MCISGCVAEWRPVREIFLGRFLEGVKLECSAPEKDPSKSGVDKTCEQRPKLLAAGRHSLLVARDVREWFPRSTRPGWGTANSGLYSVRSRSTAANSAVVFPLRNTWSPDLIGSCTPDALPSDPGSGPLGRGVAVTCTLAMSRVFSFFEAAANAACTQSSGIRAMNLCPWRLPPARKSSVCLHCIRWVS